MELGRFDLNLLLVFEALYEAGSVTGAARRLRLGQPATSAALGRLRQLVDDELFVRTAGRMVPSPRAAAIQPGVARALAEIRGALQKERFDPREDARAFTVASTDYTSFVLLPALVSAVRSEAPGVDLRIVDYDKSALPAQLESGAVDVALGVFADPPPSCVVTPLFEERFVGVTRRAHPALRSGRISRSAFLTTPHALVTVRRDVTGALDVALAKQGLARRVALTLPHMLLLPEVLARTDLLAAAPRRLVAALDTRELAEFRLPVPVAGWRVAMLWRESVRREPAVAWLRSLVVRCASQVR